MSLLPSRGPETSTRQEGEFEVVGVDEDVAPVLDALASDTARDVLNAIYDDPGTPSEIAGRLDMSIQKVAYHLEKLEDVDLIAVAGTRYSEKGQEMTVYEPPEDPLVLFVGTQERKNRLRSLVRRVVPALGVVALGGLLVQRLFGATNSWLPFGASGDSGGNPEAGYSASDGGGGGGDGAEATADVATDTPVATDGGDAMILQSETATPESTGTALDAAVNATGGGTDGITPMAADAANSGLEPGLAFFVGGVFALVLVGGWWYYRTGRR